MPIRNVVAGTLCLALLAGCLKPEPPQEGRESPVLPAAGPLLADPVVPRDAEAAGAVFEPEEGFVLIGLADCEVFHARGGDGATTWSAQGDTIVCTGKPRGYLYTKNRYRNFTLRGEFRYPPPEPSDEAKPPNTGFLIYITGEHKVWPKSLEVQGRHDEMATIKANGGAAPVEIDDDEDAREKSRRPVGEWNSVEIVSRDGALAAYLNGAKVCESRAGELFEGPVGLQSEDFEVEFRHLRVREE